MLGHLVYGRYAYGGESHSDGWLRRLLNALFRRH
jgi:hypothetical protein